MGSMMRKQFDDAASVAACAAACAAAYVAAHATVYVAAYFVYWVQNRFMEITDCL